MVEIMRNRYIKQGVYKVCSRCKEKKTPADFAKKHEKRLNLQTTKRSYCYSCRSEMNREYYQKNKEKWVKNDS